jgi:hypothetical protein
MSVERGGLPLFKRKERGGHRIGLVFIKNAFAGFLGKFFC